MHPDSVSSEQSVTVCSVCNVYNVSAPPESDNFDNSALCSVQYDSDLHCSEELHCYEPQKSGSAYNTVHYIKYSELH